MMLAAALCCCCCSLFVFATAIANVVLHGNVHSLLPCCCSCYCCCRCAAEYFTLNFWTNQLIDAAAATFAVAQGIIPRAGPILHRPSLFIDYNCCVSEQPMQTSTVVCWSLSCPAALTSRQCNLRKHKHSCWHTYMRIHTQAYSYSHTDMYVYTYVHTTHLTRMHNTMRCSASCNW